MKVIRNIGIILSLTVIQIVAMLIVGQLIQFGPELTLPEKETSQAAPILLVTSIITSLLIFYLFRKANRQDYKIIFWFIYIWFGLNTFLPQTDTWYFMEAFPTMNYSSLFKIILMGLFNYAIIIPISFYILSQSQNELIQIKIIQILNVKFLKYLLLISFLYVVIYYLAGYFIAWQFEEIIA